MLDVTRAYGLTFSIPSNDVGISLCLRNSGEFARVESDLIIDYLRARGRGSYIDVGANIGALALPIAAACPQHEVLAVEAQRYLATILAENISQNALKNASAIHAAVGAEPGVVPFPQLGESYAPEVNYGLVGLGSALVQKLPTEEVRVCTLDEIAPPDTAFVKVDVEGFEPVVLAGAQRLLSSTRPCWLLEADRAKPELVRSCMTTLRAAEYKLYWLYAPHVTPRSPKVPRTKEQWQGDLNYLAVPTEAPLNPWELTPVSTDFDLTVRRGEFRYLRRYGFNWAD